MGFFSKIFKGVKKVFKKIGKGIKKVAMKVGKFMDKVGIVGQIAMSFILPGVGGALLKGLGGTLGKVAAWAGTAGGNALVQGAKAVIGTATKFVTQTARVFNTVTSGVKNFIGEVGKTALNKIPGVNFKGAANNFFGTGGAFERAAGATAETWNTTIGSAKWMDQFDPLAGAKQTQAQITDIVSESTGYTPETTLPEDFKFGSKLPEGYTPATTGQPTSLLGQPAAPVEVAPVVRGADVDINSMYEPAPPPPPTIPKSYSTDYDTMYNPASTYTDDGFRVYEAGTGVEKTGINLTGEAVSAGATEVLKTAATSYLESGYGQPTSTGGYSAPMLLGQGEVIETAPITTGFGYNMLQFDIAQPGEAYYRRESSWQRRMQGVLS